MIENQLSSVNHYAGQIKKFGHLITGFLETQFLFSKLSSIGGYDLAFMPLNRKAFPACLYPVTYFAFTLHGGFTNVKVDFESI